jgi:hypothetical protein
LMERPNHSRRLEVVDLREDAAEKILLLRG